MTILWVRHLLAPINYAPSNPELAERVQADIDAFFEENPDVKKRGYPN